MSEKIKLMPCPFCGSTNLVKSPWIECDNCGAMGPSPRDCDNYPGGWNRRATLAKQPAAAVPEGWKLVPVESSIAMEYAGCKAASRLMGLSEANRVYRAMLAAAPAAPVAQEPVAWFTEDHLTDKSATTYDPEMAVLWRAKGWPVYPLYAAPPAAEQPDAWMPSGADYDRNIHRNPDAAAWADLFVATFPGLADKHDLMLGWFANAMMAMHDFLKAAQPDTVAVPREVLERAVDRLTHGHELDKACRELRALLAGGAE